MDAREAVRQIRFDLADRSGFGDIQNLDKDVSREIDEAWIAIIERVVNKVGDDLRIALNTIANMPYACSDAKRVAQEALKENKK